MTADQQLLNLGISAMAYEGNVIVEISSARVTTLTPSEVRRFFTNLERAYCDALTRDRAREAVPA